MPKTPKYPKGYYWIKIVDAKCAYYPEPIVAYWDESHWWVVRIEIPIAMSSVEVLSRRLSEPVHQKKKKDDKQPNDTVAAN